ncbi:MAG: metal-dependent hydrolase [Leptospiraceae bacterium]|nr:metal-dependent hydrolase [Leptospiraceae bacterium]MDW8306383.1 metal-dependent hydrolase [Leptospiraceae bacterium]
MVTSGGSITVRRPPFRFNREFPVHYYKGNPIVTHIINAFHVIFPAGEKFFIRAVNRYAAQVTDHELKERIRAFAGQETQHMAQHQKFYEILRAQGFPVDEIVKEYEEHAYGVIEPMVMSLFDRIFGPKSGDAIALSVTAALEHYTASLAEVALRHREMFSELDGELAHLLQWHAAEEIEHKSVTFDLFQEVDGRYPMRMAGFVIGSIALFAYASISAIKFLRYDRHIDWGKMPLLSAKAMVQLFFLGMEMARALLPYVRFDFHPDDIDNRELAEKYFAEYEAYFLAKAS